ncbi:MAG: hypothetical protein CMJ78_02015 [Planctomycetaceae bacterium]|nr:hypothetical protein [Planctomycetaceae bacterium]
MANVSVFCFLASYVVTFALELTRLMRRSPVKRFIMLGFASAGFLAHTFYLLYRGLERDLPPLLSSTQDWVLVLAWLATLFYLFVSTLDRDLAIGLFLLPLVLLLIVAANFLSAQTMPLVGVVRSWAMLHASLLVLGITGVIVGFVLSMMYLVQHRRLKSKQTSSTGLKLPSLAKLARWNWWAVMISFPLLTLGMGTGVWLGFLSRKVPEPISYSDPVVIVNSVGWLMMAAFLIWLSMKRNSAGKHVASMTTWAFGFLLLTLIGTQLLVNGGFESWH